jgi:hypothetical protein
MSFSAAIENASWMTVAKSNARIVHPAMEDGFAMSEFFFGIREGWNDEFLQCLIEICALIF